MSELPRTKWDYIYYALIAATILSFALALLGWVGEQLGWWNDVGELLMMGGSIGGVGLAATTLVVGSSRSQVQETTKAVKANGSKLDGIDGRLGSVDETIGSVDDQISSVDDQLGDVDEELSQQTRILRDIRDAL